MGRTEFLTETDCERALVGRAKAKASTRAKWRSSSSACRRVLEKCLTPPTLLEMGMLQQLTVFANCSGRWPRLLIPMGCHERRWCPTHGGRPGLRVHLNSEGCPVQASLGRGF